MIHEKAQEALQSMEGGYELAKKQEQLFNEKRLNLSYQSSTLTDMFPLSIYGIKKDSTLVIGSVLTGFGKRAAGPKKSQDKHDLMEEQWKEITATRSQVHLTILNSAPQAVDKVFSSITNLSEDQASDFIIVKIAEASKSTLEQIVERVSFKGGYTEDHVSKVARLLDREMKMMADIHDQIGKMINVCEMAWVRAYTCRFFEKGKYMNANLISNVKAMIALK